MPMMPLEHLREYRTCFHIVARYGLSESSTDETLRWVEDTRVKSGALALPGKKARVGESTEIEVIRVDVTETPATEEAKQEASANESGQTIQPAKRPANEA